MPRFFWVLLVPLAGCQLVLGFEDHEPFPPGTGGAGATTSTMTTTGTGMVSGSTGSTSTGGGGGQAPVITFGDAEEIGDASEALTDLAVESSEIYALRPGMDEIVVLTEGQSMVSQVAGDLIGARGLRFDGGVLYTTAFNGTSMNCETISVTPSGTPTVIFSEASPANCYVAVGAEGAKVAASKGIEVRSSESSGQGRLIGKAYSGSNIPAVAVAEGKYFWVDATSGKLLRTNGATVQPQHNPPGNQVDTVASMTGPVDLALRNGQVYVIGESGVGKVASSTVNGSFAILTTVTENPKGISVDATHVYWADGPSVRAVPIGADAAQPTVLYQGSETPNDTFSRGDAIFFTTQSGKIFRLTKTIH